MVILKPTPFLATRDGALISYHKATIANGNPVKDLEAVTRKIPSIIFDVNFQKWPGARELYYKTQEPYAALRIDEPFNVTDVIDGTSSSGQAGDFLVTRSSGINFVVSKDDFEEKFIKADTLELHLAQELKITCEPTLSM